MQTFHNEAPFVMQSTTLSLCSTLQIRTPIEDTYLRGSSFKMGLLVVDRGEHERAQLSPALSNIILADESRTHAMATQYATKTRGRPFRRGNPGKPQGSRHKTTLAIENLLDGDAEKLTRKAIDLALAGDTTALRLCLERVAPLRRGRPVAFPLPKVNSPSGVSGALAAILTAMASGVLTPDEAVAVANVVECQRKAIETEQLEARMLAIEAQLKSNAQSN